MRKAITRFGFVITLVGIFLFALGGSALAGFGSHPSSPHGGYSATTQYCLQCHSVHSVDADPQAGQYALLADTSVTAICKTCHSIGVDVTNMKNEEGVPREVDLSGGAMSTASDKAAYTVPAADRVGQHEIGFSTGYDPADPTAPIPNPVPYSTLQMITQYASRSSNSTTPAGPGTADASDGGLYCASCHTPHGDFGQLVNSVDPAPTSAPVLGFRSTYYSPDADGNTGTTSGDLSVVRPVQEGEPFYVGSSLRYLHWTGTVWQACTDAALTDCAAWAITDAQGLPTYGYGYKILSAFPNHTYGDLPESYYMARRGLDSARWCGKCHDLTIPERVGGMYHSHPTACDYCHGNPTDQTIASTDFPHTSTFDRLLKQYPDGLCISCHGAGRLP
jgi:hypothetical protein